MDLTRAELLSLLGAASALTWLVTGLWATRAVRALRIYCRDRLADVEEAVQRSTPKELGRMQDQLDTMKRYLESTEVSNESFRSKVHNEIQRFDQIMRRNERAVKRLDEAKEEPVEYPQEVPAAGIGPQEGKEEKPPAFSKKELWEMYRRSRGI